MASNAGTVMGGAVVRPGGDEKKGNEMVIDFLKFIRKLFLGQYDEMGWEDLFHGFFFIVVSCGVVYLVT